MEDLPVDATDQDGNTYVCSYSNQVRITETNPGSGCSRDPIDFGTLLPLCDPL